MIQIRLKYRPIAAFVLASLLIGAFVLKEAHHLLDHHHEETLLCESDGETHLHSEEYVAVNCFICFLSFAPFEETIDTPQVKQPLHFPSSNFFSYQSPSAACKIYSPPLRGPPSLV